MKKLKINKATVLVMVLVVLGVAGYFAFRTSTRPNLASQRYWIFGKSALNDVAVSSQALQSLKNDTIYLIDNSSKPISSQAASLKIVPTDYFTSEAQLAAAISNNTIPANTKAILYDNEHWSLTPVIEQQNPVAYYQKAFNLAHAHGYVFIATPSPSSLVPRIAQYADVVDIQAQSVQATPSDYASHVLPYANQARSINHQLIILSGLSTNPRAGVPTPSQLVNDVNAVSPTVQGYWLNIPAKPAICLTNPSLKGGRCQGPQPQVAIDFLSLLK